MRSSSLAIARAVVAAAILLCGALGACADTKVALVIGNSKYPEPLNLANPVNDAKDLSDSLKKMGFQVDLRLDVDKSHFDQALADFARAAAKADIALFYYAGHGVQFHGQNYFLPVDNLHRDNADIEFESVDMASAVRAANKAPKIKILIVDACRNSVDSGRTTKSRSWTGLGDGDGLAPINGTDGMIVFYSAEHNKPALDTSDSAAHSPFAESLIARIEAPGTEIEDAFRDISDDVFVRTKQQQHPEIVTNELRSKVYLNPAETAEQVWARIRKSTDPKVLHQFIKDFPDSPLADAAQFALDKIELEQRMREDEETKQQQAQKAAAAAAEKAAQERRAEEAKAAEQARLDKERADKEAAAKALAEKQAQLAAEKEAQKQVEEQKKADERRKAEEAVAEQARIAKEKADEEAEAKRLADQAAAAKKALRDEADAARRATDREAVDRATEEAEQAAEAAKKLEEEKRQAKLEEDLRKKQAAEAAAKELAEACSHDLGELAHFKEAGQSEAIQAMRTHSVCPALPAAADQATKELVARQAIACADEQKSLAQIEPKNEDAWKARLEALKCPAARDAASAQIAKLESDRLRLEHDCADKREKFAAVDLFVPDARDKLAALPINTACAAVAADVKAAIASIDARISTAQGELKRVGCYTAANPSGRFDALTITALKDYLNARHATFDAPRITDGFVEELRAQDFVVCTPPAAPVAAHPTVTQTHVTAVPALVPKRILARPEPLIRPAHVRPVAESSTEARQVVPRQATPKPAAAAPSLRPAYIPAF
jgi:Caspase domain